MTLPIQFPLPPMEATLVRELPDDTGWQFEPKWDGFRCIVFRDGDDVLLQSKAGQPLARYFPEIVEAVRSLDAQRFVIDGEIVIPSDGGYSFDALLQRIHPAASRVKRLSQETPGRLMVFDLLVDPRGRSLLEVPLSERRPQLEQFARDHFARGGRVVLSPATASRATATRWEAELRGNGIDGLIAKRLDAPYRTGERDAMQKVKWLKTADCVVGGFRYGQRTRVVGSLLLGLYDQDGVLHHVGFCANIPRADRESLTRELERLVAPPGFTGRAPGGPSRWSRGRSTEWEPLRPKLVVEVTFDAFAEGRFRHGTSLVRFRSDKRPDQCTFEQLEPAKVKRAAATQTNAPRAAAKRTSTRSSTGRATSPRAGRRHAR